MKTRLLALFIVLPFAEVPAQIPNGDFEVWNDMGGYLDPAYWGSLNYMTAPAGFVTCVQGSPGYSGAYYMRLTVPDTVGSINLGFAACTGSLNDSTVILVGTGPSFQGIPFDQRPAFLTGATRYSCVLRYFVCELSRWDSVWGERIVIARAHFMAPGDQPDWTPFALPFNYDVGGSGNINHDTPDTMRLSMGPEQPPGPGDFFDIDALGLLGQVGVEENGTGALLAVFPSPCANTLNVQATRASSVRLSLLDLGGRILMDHLPANGPIDVSALAPGLYAVRAVLNNGSVVQERIVKQ